MKNHKKNSFNLFDGVLIYIDTVSTNNLVHTKL